LSSLLLPGRTLPGLHLGAQPRHQDVEIERGWVDRAGRRLGRRRAARPVGRLGGAVLDAAQR
jgi:hypothetical protein